MPEVVEEKPMESAVADVSPFSAAWEIQGEGEGEAQALPCKGHLSQNWVKRKAA